MYNKWKEYLQYLGLVGTDSKTSTTFVMIMPKYLPLHYDLPLALALGADVVEESCVVIRISAAQNQFSSWDVFWVSDAKIYMLTVEIGKHNNVNNIGFKNEKIKLHSFKSNICQYCTIRKYAGQNLRCLYLGFRLR